MADFVDKVTAGDLSSLSSGVREADDARKSRVESAGRRLMGDYTTSSSSFLRTRLSGKRRRTQCLT